MQRGLSKQKIGRPGVRRRHEAVTITKLKAQLEEQAALISAQAASLAHSQKIFERSSAAARIGVWQCNLADQSLHWTDVVYDIFDLPRGSALIREEIVKCYTAASAAELHVRRSKGIEERTGFGLDAEIVTVKGNRRWIRITASVESEDGIAVRIFGMKQDITEEKILADQTRYLAEFDVMTGLANRSQFQKKLAELTACCADRSAHGALLLVDLDGFKQINDTFGHVTGDECLRHVPGDWNQPVLVWSSSRASAATSLPCWWERSSTWPLFPNLRAISSRRSAGPSSTVAVRSGLVPRSASRCSPRTPSVTCTSRPTPRSMLPRPQGETRFGFSSQTTPATCKTIAPLDGDGRQRWHASVRPSSQPGLFQTNQAGNGLANFRKCTRYPRDEHGHSQDLGQVSRSNLKTLLRQSVQPYP
ncbi:diguanylate cyclase (GGDEF)-like protein [Aminobacter sp. AP02]|nr:diguanylate cyclase (GGDEF)-like protein [Aminobacter sp. AP02]